MKFSQTLTNIGGKIENQLLIDDYSYFSVLFIGSRFNISLNKFIDAVFNYNCIYTDSMNVFFSSKNDCDNFIIWLDSLLIANKLSKNNI